MTRRRATARRSGRAAATEPGGDARPSIRRPSARADAIALETAPLPRFAPELIVALLGAIALWIAFRVATGIRLEDALITARYAENLAAGRGWVFNPGERVLGTTSPLHTLVLALFALPFGGNRVGAIAVAVGIAAATVAVVLLHRALLRAGVGRATAFAAAALFAIQPDTLWATTGGLETPLVLAFMLMGLDAALAGRWNRVGFASGLLILTRLDGIVWAGLLVGWTIWSARGRAWQPLVLMLAVLAPWIAFSSVYFGSPIPHSVVAKRAISAGPGLVEYPQWLFDSLGLHVTKHGTPVFYAIWIAFVLIGAVAILARPGRRRLWPVVVFPPVFTAAMAAVHAPWFEWYLLPVTWCGVVMAVLGAETLVDAVGRFAPERSWSLRARGVAAIVLAALVVWGVALQGARTYQEQRAFQENEDGTRRLVGEWLRDHLPANASVAMEAIGYQGTYANRRVIDLAGIVTPEVVRIRQRSRTNAETFERILERFRPDAVVLRTLEVERGLAMHGGPLFETPEQRARFLAEYRPAAQFIAPHIELWGALAALTIYRRASVVTQK